MLWNKFLVLAMKELIYTAAETEILQRIVLSVSVTCGLRKEGGVLHLKGL